MYTFMVCYKQNVLFIYQLKLKLILVSNAFFHGVPQTKNQNVFLSLQKHRWNIQKHKWKFFFAHPKIFSLDSIRKKIKKTHPGIFY